MSSLDVDIKLSEASGRPIADMKTDICRYLLAMKK
jgi:hypothetical protein